MLLAKAGLVPKDGYWFEEMDKSRHKARSWLELERKVITYRRINRFPMGNVLTEIFEQAEKRWPVGFWRKTVRGE